LSRADIWDLDVKANFSAHLRTALGDLFFFVPRADMHLFESPREYCRHENLIARPELGLAGLPSNPIMKEFG
jgi:hypothetical protein